MVTSGLIKRKSVYELKVIGTATHRRTWHWRSINSFHLFENDHSDGPAGREERRGAVDGQDSVVLDSGEFAGNVVVVEEADDANKTQIDGRVRPAAWHDPEACHERSVGQVVERRGRREWNGDEMLVLDDGAEGLVGHRALEETSGSELLLIGEGRLRVGSGEFDGVCSIDELLHVEVHLAHFGLNEK